LYEWCLTTAHGHHTDVLLYNAAGDISHITTKVEIKGVSTYDKVTDFKDKLPTEELDHHMAFQETICTHGNTAYQCHARDPLFAQLVHRLPWKGMVVTSRVT
jgi:hypothetical protein